MSMMNFWKENFCPERMLSDLMFLNFLQREQRQMSRSEDLDAAQEIRVMLFEQVGQVEEGFRIPLWNRKSLACSSASLIA